jgi:hypothetical protein
MPSVSIESCAGVSDTAPSPRHHALRHHARPERRIVRTATLAHDLDPLHRSCICGSHCGCHIRSLIPGLVHAAQNTGRGLREQGVFGRTPTNPAIPSAL